MTKSRETTAPEKRGWAASVSVAVLAIILALLLVFPGFLAGFLQRAGWGVVYGGMNPHFAFYTGNAHWRLSYAVLYPCLVLIRHSYTLREFYVWEYHMVNPAPKP